MGTASNAIKVDGLTDFRAAVKRLSPEVSKEFRKDLKAVADIVAAEARADIPVVTGTARASIKASTSGSYVQVVAGGPSAPYYPWLDFGGTLRPTGGRKNYIKRARLKKGRYIYPNIDTHLPEIAAGADRAIRAAARKVGLEVT